jgi:hypothetical protein
MTKKNTKKENVAALKKDDVIEIPDGLKIVQLELMVLQSRQKQLSAELALTNQMANDKMAQIRANPEWMKILQIQQQAQGLSNLKG